MGAVACAGVCAEAWGGRTPLNTPPHQPGYGGARPIAAGDNAPPCCCRCVYTCTRKCQSSTDVVVSTGAAPVALLAVPTLGAVPAVPASGSTAVVASTGAALPAVVCPHLLLCLLCLQVVKQHCCQHVPEGDVVLLPLDLVGDRWAGRCMPAAAAAAAVVALRCLQMACWPS